MSPTETNTTNLSVLNKYSVDNWVVFTNSLLFRTPTYPLSFAGYEEPHHILFGIYKLLTSETSKENLSSALSILLESVPATKSNSERLYYIIQLISLIRPIQAKSYLRRILFENSLVGFKYHDNDLQSLLLIAVSKYNVDDDLIYYINRFTNRKNEFKYYIIALRALSFHSDTMALEYIQRLFPFLENNSYYLTIQRQLDGITGRYGYRKLYYWYVENNNIFQNKYGSQFLIFRQLLTELLDARFDEEISLEQLDPYAWFLKGELNDDQNSISIKSVMHMLKHQKITDKDEIINLLKKLISKYRAISLCNPAYISYFTLSDVNVLKRSIAPIFKDKMPDCVVFDRNNDAIELNTIADSDILQILHEVSYPLQIV